MTILWMGRNGVGPHQRPLTFGLMFWMWFLLLGTLAVAALAPLVWWIDRALRRPLAIRIVLGGLTLYVLWAALSLNRRAFRNLWSMAASPAFRWQCVIVAGLSILGLLATSLPLRWRAVARGLGLLAALGFVLAFRPVPAPPPPPSELARFPPADSKQRLLLIGLDGASWEFMEPLIARGDLPNIAELRNRGAWGKLTTLKPTLSPALWTTIVTGQRPRRNGIEDFSAPHLRGVHESLPELQPLPGLDLGLPALLKRIGQVVDTPITSDARREAALWNIATFQRSPMNVVAWFVTWPAEPLLGAMVSDRIFHYPLGTARSPQLVTYPEDLYRALATHVVRMEDVSLEDLRRFVETTPEQFAARGTGEGGIRLELRKHYANFQTTRRAALFLLEADQRRYGRPRDTLVYFSLLDKAKHKALRHSEFSVLEPESPEAARDYRRVVTEAYRCVDQAVGELVRAFGQGNVLIVSDHGWGLEGRHRDVYGHFEAPDGIWLGAGPAFVPRDDLQLSIYDVFPVLARLKGFPLSRALPGRVPEEIFAPAILTAPARFVADYGPRAAVSAGPPSAEVDAEVLDELRALGYIQ
jgi:hypothetical protein